RPGPSPACRAPARSAPSAGDCGRLPAVPAHRGVEPVHPAEGAPVIGFIVFGLVVGVVARLLVPGRQRLGIGMTLLLGLVGSIIGGVVANALGTGDIWELNIIGSIVAIAAAVVLIVIGEQANAFRSRGDRRRR